MLSEKLRTRGSSEIEKLRMEGMSEMERGVELRGVDKGPFSFLLRCLFFFLFSLILYCERSKKQRRTENERVDNCERSTWRESREVHVNQRGTKRKSERKQVLDREDVVPQLWVDEKEDQGQPDKLIDSKNKSWRGGKDDAIAKTTKHHGKSWSWWRSNDDCENLLTQQKVIQNVHCNRWRNVDLALLVALSLLSYRAQKSSPEQYRCISTMQMQQYIPSSQNQVQSPRISFTSWDDATRRTLSTVAFPTLHAHRTELAVVQLTEQKETHGE